MVARLEMDNDISFSLLATKHHQSFEGFSNHAPNKTIKLGMPPPLQVKLNRDPLLKKEWSWALQYWEWEHPKNKTHQKSMKPEIKSQKASQK